MNTFISMLRGINVSGQKKIRMAELRDLYKKLYFTNVETYVQSGNVVFDSNEEEQAALSAIIEKEIEQSFGYSVSVLVRTADDLQKVIDSNPFLNERNEDSARLYVTFLSHAPLESKLNNLYVAECKKDEFFVKDKEIFLFCPNGYGRTKLTNNFFEKKLNLSATTRNWKTVNALCNMANKR